MPVIIDQVETACPGGDIFLGSVAEDGRAAVVFEDDGTTAYLYASERANGPVVDALHIYDVAQVVDREQPSEYKLGWSPAGRHAMLLINGHPHAVFDFDRRQGWCRSGFPPPPSQGGWSAAGHAWDDACLVPFR